MTTSRSLQAVPWHRRFGLLAQRYATVFGAAWAARRELDGPIKLAHETAFLPAALALQETPVHPAPRRIMMAIALFFIAALSWAYWGQLDIVATAPGRIVVSEGSKVVQPLESGVVHAIHVKEGDLVQQGQVLLELDDTDSKADDQSVDLQLQTALGEQRLAQQLLQAMQGQGLVSAAALTPEQEPRLHVQWQDIQSKRQQLEAMQQTRQAQLLAAQAALQKLQASIPLIKSREADYQALAKEGFVHQHAIQDLTRQRIEAELELRRLEAEATQFSRSVQEAVQAKAAWAAETQRALTDRFKEASDSAARLQQEKEKSGYRESRMRLTAPVTGIVQQMATLHTGSVVTPAQTLMVLVPQRTNIRAEVLIANKDIGFVREGDQARIKLDAFNFTKYGTLDATVIDVSADAVMPGESSSIATLPIAAQLAQPAMFSARLRLHQTHIDVQGRLVQLMPGMTIAAEIKTGRRSVLDYLLSPIERTINEGGRER